MAKLWTIIKREYLERVRTRWFIVATVFGPVFFGSLILLPAYFAKRNKASTEFTNLIVLDATKSGMGQKLADAIGTGKSPGSLPPIVRVLPPDQLTAAESTATHQVMQKQASGYVVIDDGTLKGEEIRYAGRNATQIADMERLRSTLKESLLAERLEAAGVKSDSVKELTFMPLRMNAVRITDKGRGGSGAVSIIFAGVVGFLLYMTIVLYGQNVLRGVLEEKTTRVAEVVVSSVSSETLLAGKVLGVGAVGLTQQIIWVIATYIMFKLRQPLMARLGATTMPFELPSISIGFALILLLFFFLGFMFYASLYAAVGASVNTEQEAQQAVMPMLIFLVATAMFINPVLMNPTSRTATVMSILPFSAPIIMPLRLAIGTVSWWELAAALVALALSVIVAMWVAGRIYRVGLLMYGKKPSFREMGRWVRYSN